MLYYFWTTMYSLRAFMMVSYVAFANATLAVTEKNLRAILLMVLVVAFLLDLDEYTFLTFFAERDDLGTIQLGVNSKMKIGRETKAACVRVRQATMKAVTAVQVLLMLVLKTHPWVHVIWGMPVLSFLLLWIQQREMPKVAFKFVDAQWVLMLLFVGWLVCFHCALTPMCLHPMSRYWHAAPWDDVPHVSEWIFKDTPETK